MWLVVSCILAATFTALVSGYHLVKNGLEHDDRKGTLAEAVFPASGVVGALLIVYSILVRAKVNLIEYR